MSTNLDGALWMLRERVDTQRADLAFKTGLYKRLRKSTKRACDKHADKVKLD